jgi:inosine-uridine nucleoside N-ribohydrolase
VLKAGLPTELVGLDVTREAVLGSQEIMRLTNASTANARWISDALRFYLEYHQQAEKLDGCIVNDVLPIAALIKPATLEFEERRLTVDLEDGDHRGRTRSDQAGSAVRVALQVDMALVRPLLSERVFRWATRTAAPQPEGAEA